MKRILTSLLVASTISCYAAMQPVSGSPSQIPNDLELYGNVIASDNDASGQKTHQGIWKISTSGNFEGVYTVGLGGGFTGVYIDGYFFNFYSWKPAPVVPNYILNRSVYKTDNWDTVKTPNMAVADVPYSLCNNGSDVWGTYKSGTQWKFGKIDLDLSLSNTVWTPIANIPAEWNCCAYGNDGMIYAIDMNGDLHKVDPATGAMTKIGATGITPSLSSGAIIDKGSGKMYWAAYMSDKSGLYQVDLTTGAASQVCEFAAHDRVTCLYDPSEPKEPAKKVEMFGNVIDSNKDASNQRVRQGIWKLDTAGNFEGINAVGLGGGFTGVYIDGYFYNFYTWKPVPQMPTYILNRSVYKTDNWDTVKTPNMAVADVPYSLCNNGSDVWGTYKSGTQWKFGKIDLDLSLANTVWTPIANIPAEWNCCAYGNDGMIYAIDMSGDLHKVDPATGAMTKIGATGITPSLSSGAIIDKNSGQMFWAAYMTDKSGLYEVDLTTGAASQLYEFENHERITCLYIPFVALDKAPAAVTDLSANFNEDALKGNINFTCPSTFFDNTPASGELSYTITANNKLIASGQAAFGEQVSKEITLDAGGLYTFSVIVKNAGGESPAATTDAFVGLDQPKPVVATAKYNDGKFHVEWPTVIEAANGGWMDKSKISYSVTRQPGSVQVADKITATSIDDPLARPETPTTYYYEVTVNYDGKAIATSKSNSVGLGGYIAPWSETFDTAEAASKFTIIDARQDGATFKYHPETKSMRCGYSSYTKNDWLITPAVELQQGKTYKISFDASGDGVSYPEKVEAWIGTEPTVAKMTTKLVNVTELVSRDIEYKNLSQYFTAPSTGNYYLGIHAVSDADLFYLYVDNVEFGEPIDFEAPNMVTELKATADIHGELKALVSGKAPTKAYSGKQLMEISEVIISRDGTVVKQLTGVKPGDAFEWLDENVPARGEHSYSVICKNNEGAGNKAETKVFVGYNLPAQVTDVKIEETTPGTVKLSWAPVTTDIDGKILKEGTVKYRVVDSDFASTVYGENLSEPSLTIQVNDGENQKSFVGRIFAETEIGVSEGVISQYNYIVGKPYQLPYCESYKGGLSSKFSGQRHLPWVASWTAQRDGYEGINSADGDDGFMVCKQFGETHTSMIYTGKIDIADTSDPYFSFYVYNLFNDATPKNLNEIDVMVGDANSYDDTWQSVLHSTIDDLCDTGVKDWKKVFVSLKQFKGKTIQVGIRVKCMSHVYTLLDKIELRQYYDRDLAATDIAVPAKAAPHIDFPISVTVENTGMKDVDNYVVEFYRKDVSEPFATVGGTPLAVGKSTTLSTNYQFNFDDTDASASFYGVVNLSSDQDAYNNETANAEVTRKYHNVDGPKNLKATADKSTVNLSWDSPALKVAKATGPQTEDFESFESWAYDNPEGWTFIDVDQLPINSFKVGEFPNNPEGSKRAFFVFDQKTEIFNSEYFAAHSGTKYLAAMCDYYGRATEDYAISPELSGREQTVSFYVRSDVGLGTEKVDLLYSTTGKEISDFKLVKSITNISAEWTKYSFDIPEGAKYFAVCNHALQYTMLMLDDFTFETLLPEHKGYNVYYDGKKINNEIVTTSSYIHNDVEDGAHTYHVTAVYVTDEESEPAKTTISVNASSVDNLTDGQVSVVSGKGFIRVNGASGRHLAVVRADGITYWDNTASETETIELPQGVYTICIDRTVYKAVVR